MTRFSPTLSCAALFCALTLSLLSGCGGSAATRGPDVAERAVRPAGRSSPVVTPSTSTGYPVPAADVASIVLATEEGAPVSPSTEAAIHPTVQPAAAPAAPTAAVAAPAKPTAASQVSSGLYSGSAAAPVSGDVADCWQPLVQRLRNDPRVTPEVVRYFCNLPEYSPNPMGVKVKELFTNAFLRKKKPDDGAPKPPPSRIYRNMVTAATVQKCNDFLIRNKTYFDAVEKKYPVPRRILVSLLFVETRLGTFIGTENAFWSLACMAAANSPERMAGGLGDIPITDKHDDWLKAKLADKSEWAYKELRSLLAFCSTQNLDPRGMPGSVYGAIGICQFMPSNLDPYGEDGDGDGVVNLFSEPDAIFSAARYLTKHGWSDNLSVERQRAVLKRYNNLNIYANTILALAESVRTGVLQTGPPDSVKATASKKKKK